MTDNITTIEGHKRNKAEGFKWKSNFFDSITKKQVERLEKRREALIALLDDVTETFEWKAERSREWALERQTGRALEKALSAVDMEIDYVSTMKLSDFIEEPKL